MPGRGIIFASEPALAVLESTKVYESDRYRRATRARPILSGVIATDPANRPSSLSLTQRHQQGATSELSRVYRAGLNLFPHGGSTAYCSYPYGGVDTEQLVPPHHKI